MFILCASCGCSSVPDWGDSPSWQPSSSANMDDEAVSQQLQEQFNREVGGGASSGFGLSLEDESLAVARMLQVWASLVPPSVGTTFVPPSVGTTLYAPTQLQRCSTSTCSVSGIPYCGKQAARHVFSQR